jgi:hypothetical protein
MNADTSKRAYWMAAIAGGILWFLTSAIGGRREPWDTALYWSVAYPIAIVIAGTLGYMFPQRPWRWALVVMFMQGAVMIVGGSGFGLLPLGLILLGVLSLPAVAVASLTARMRRQKGDA